MSIHTITDRTALNATDIAFRPIVPLPKFLDTIYTQLQDCQSDPAPHLDVLFDYLHKLRSSLSDLEWVKIIHETIKPHPLTPFLSMDPCTHHSQCQPRGYPGDAELLDFFYKKSKNYNTYSASVQRLINYTISRPAGKAVRDRLIYLAEEIDSVSFNQPSPRILSLACGHLRELGLSKAVLQGKVGEIVGVDHDPKTLEFVKSEWGGFGVKTIQASVRKMLSAAPTFGKFDFVYSAGLFDYLDDRLAARVMGMLVEMLRPNGTIVLTNFNPTLPDIGYMEAIMNWKLIYRSIEQMDAIIQMVSRDGILEKCVDSYRIPSLNIMRIRYTKSA